MNQNTDSAEAVIGGRVEDPAMNQVDGSFKKRLLLFSGWIFLSSLLFAKPLTILLRTSILSDDASYLIFIPFISAWTLLVDRRKVFLNLSYDAAVGGGLLSCAVCV